MKLYKLDICVDDKIVMNGVGIGTFRLTVRFGHLSNVASSLLFIPALPVHYERSLYGLLCID